MASQRMYPGQIAPGLNRSGAPVPKNCFVIDDVDKPAKAVQVAAAGTVPLVGIAMELIADTYNGDICKSGSYVLILGGDSITKGMLLTATTGGKGVEAAAGEWYGARALQDGDTDDLIEVEIMFGMIDDPGT